MQRSHTCTAWVFNAARVFFGAVLAASTMIVADAQAAIPSFFRPIGATSAATRAGGPEIAKAARLAVSSEPELLRVREVEPDGELLLSFATQLEKSKTEISAMRVDFFIDASFTVEFTSAMRVGNGTLNRTVLTGYVPGAAYSAATFVVKAGTVVGNVHVGDRVYQLRFRENADSVDGGDGLPRAIHEIREIDPSRFRDHGPGYDDFIRQEVLRGEKPAQLAAAAPLARSLEVSRDDGNVVDVLVAYTATTRAAAGGVAAIVAQIELAVSETNLAYANSGVVHRLRLVKTLEVDYAETGSSSTDLNRLRNRGDRFMDEIHAYRAAYGADIVSLIVERMDDACGIGFLMSTVTTAFASSAFNVVARGCATGIFTFAHEVGHNMGLRHDSFEDPGITPFPDAHGYVDLVARFRTVMAYNDACTSKGFSCRRVPNFSNPDVLVQGALSGSLGSANAVRVLNETRVTASNFVQAVDFSGGGPVTFIKTSYSGSEGGPVVLTVERVGGAASATGAASVQWATVAGSAAAGADFSPASGTINWAVGDFAPKTITVSLLQDSVVEGTKFFTVALGNAVGATIGVGIATVAVLDDEAGVFPPGCVMPVGWANNVDGSALGWVVATDNSGEGRCSLKSGAIGDSGSNNVKILSRISVSGSFQAGSIRFSRRVSSEDTFDCFRFTIDGVQQNVGGQCSAVGGLGASGEVPWGTVEFPVAAGSHTFTWSYEKDANSADGDDAAWIDDVRLPQEATLLTVLKSGNGAGTVTGTPAGINCGATCSQAVAPNASVTLNAQGTAPDTFSGWSGACSGAGACVLTMDASKLVIASFSAPLGSKPLDYSDIWWAGESENGWGMSITQHSPSNIQLNTFYVYETNRAATWFVMPGGTWNADFTVFTGALYRPSGNALNDFDAAKVVVGASVGNATLTFTSASSMTVSYTINGTAGTKNMVRQSFGTPTASLGLRVGDIWWGGAAQNGWGVSIIQQYNTLFGVWYTYGLLGVASWFVMPGGSWSGNTYTGTMYATTGSPWLGASYNPASLVITPVGTMTFSFTPDANGVAASNGQFTYRFTSGNFSGVNQTRGISRQPF